MTASTIEVRKRRSVGTTPRRAAGLAGIASAIAVIVLAIGMGGGASYFVGFGEESPRLEFAKELLGDGIAVPLIDGHDGERFWVLARDPLLVDATETASHLERPAYRAQRIGYPLVASPWRIFGEHALLWGLVGTNVLVIVIGTWMTGTLAGRNGAPNWLAYAFAFNPLVVLSLLFDLSDAMALAGIIGVLLALRERRTGWAIVGGVVAGLAKEVSLVALAAAAVFTRGLTWTQRALVVVPAGLSVAVWHLYVVSRPGFGGDVGVREFETVPFAGFPDTWRRFWQPGHRWFDVAVAALIVVFAVAVVALWWRRRSSLEWSAAIGPCLMFPFLSIHVVSQPGHSLRAIGLAITCVLASGLARPVRGERTAPMTTT